MFTVRVPLWYRFLFGGLAVATIILCTMMFMNQGMQSVFEGEDAAFSYLLYIFLPTLCLWLIRFLRRNYFIVDVDEIAYFPVIGPAKIFNWEDIGVAKVEPARNGYRIFLYNHQGRRIAATLPLSENIDEFKSSLMAHGKII